MKKFILVGGMPRSGTTLIETILGSHSKISIPPGDFPFARLYIQGLSVEKIFAAMSKRGPWNQWHLKDFSSLFGMEHAQAFRESMIRYAESIHKDIPAAKAPYTEFYYDIYKGWLVDFEVKFVHIVRNPFDVMASLKHSQYHKQMRMFRDAISLQAKNWNRSTSMGLARGLLDPENYHLIKYETFVEDPIASGQKICSFLGVNFEEERMLNRADYSYHDTNTSFSGKESRNVEKNGYIYRPESRKSYLDTGEKKLISDQCGEIAKSLGYDDHEFRFFPPFELEKMKPAVRLKKKVNRIFKRILNK